MPRFHQLARLVHKELHAVELTQQVVGKLDIRLVDLVDEQHWSHFRLERFPEAPLHYVVTGIVHPRLTELRIAQARYRVILVKTLLRLARRLDVPLVKGAAERSRDLLSERRFSRTRLPLDEKGSSQRNS